MIIDGHSHIGIDYYNGCATFNEYSDFCKRIGISKSIIMPMPWPCFCDDGLCCALLWEHDGKYNRNYYKIDNNKGTKENVTANPYERINNFIYNKYAFMHKNLDVYFAPLLHGVLDTPEQLEKQLIKNRVVAVKIHGFASGFTVEDMNPELIEVLQYFQLPIIIHTSIYNYNYGYGYETKYWRNLDHPLRWANFLIDNNLNGVLNHGACLNEETIKMVNKYDNLKIGIGPDLDINNDYFKVDIPKERYEKISYLKELKKKVSADKLVFDIDYNWNVNPNCKNIDCDAVNRIKSVWSEADQDKILSSNAKSFFTRIRE